MEEWVGVGIVHNHWGGLNRCTKRAHVVLVLAEAGCIERRYVTLQGDVVAAAVQLVINIALR